MKNENKKLIVIILSTITLIFAILLCYTIDQKKQLKITNLDKNVNLGSNSNIKYNIDSVEFVNGICYIKAWAVIEGINSYNIKPTIILGDQKNNRYKLKTIIIQRPDITKLYNGNSFDENSHLTCVTPSMLGVTKNKFVYDNSGICSEFLLTDLNKNQRYKIGIQLKTNEKDYFIWTANEFTF